MQKRALIALAPLAIACGPRTPPPAAAAPEAPRPPVAEPEDTVFELHGQTRADPYHWMKDREDPRTIPYLEAENTYAEAVTAHTEGLQSSLFQEMKARIQEDDSSVPVRVGDYEYYSRTAEGQDYPIYCRRPVGGGDEQILLDANERAEGQDYYGIGTYNVSPDHGVLAWSEDTDGSEEYTLYFKDLRTGELLPDTIPGVSWGSAWAGDNAHLFYTTMDDAHRPWRLHRHALGDAGEDALVYQEDDEAFYLSVRETLSEEWILLSLGSAITSEVHLIDAAAPAEAPRLVRAREDGVEYDVEPREGTLYITTNQGAMNFKLMTAPADAPGEWSELIAPREDVTLRGVDLFKDHMVVYENWRGLAKIQIRPFDGAEPHYVAFPEPVYDAWPTGNAEYETATLRFGYTSLTSPTSVWDYDVISQERALRKEYSVPGGFDASEYVADRIWATAPDGTEVPISLVHRADVTPGPETPVYLTGYGAYGSSYDVYFSSNRLSLLDRGFVYAIAHVRGGADLGRGWYEDGKYLKKKNTFTDFIACAEHLVAAGYTTPERIAINGGSAGGLLMGAVTNMRPDLFAVVVADVPFVDVINTMLDETIPLTVTEWDEWGNPNDPEYYAYMRSYAPYENVEAKAYPRMLVTAGLNDPRVGYWEPAKWVARLRANKTDDNLLVLKTNMDAGHGGASGRYGYLREIAFEYAFILDQLGLADAAPGAPDDATGGERE